MKFSLALFTVLTMASTALAAPTWNWRYSDTAAPVSAEQEDETPQLQPADDNITPALESPAPAEEITYDMIDTADDSFEHPNSFSGLANNMGMFKEDDFDNIDINHDGYVDEDEFLQFQTNNFSTMINQTFELLDSNQDNKISQEEIIAYYGRQNSDEKIMQSILQRFSNADLDNNKFLDNPELHHFLQKDLLNNNKMIFQLFDTNQDGHITREEMSQIKGMFRNFYQ
ncbi:MAG: EF-hand domain-containing protein [Pseudomonadota bacterium]|nr:EF-hand domain-containing protein [Pseudomonadota bacterium]